MEFRCSKCGEYKPKEEFYKNKNTKSGLTSRCKLCIIPNKGASLMPTPINQKFNFLTVVSEGERIRIKHKTSGETITRTVNCLCDCGNMVYNKRLAHVKSLKIQSCGCHLTTRDVTDKTRGLLGERYTPSWWTYVGMRKRCLLSSHIRFKDYGGRGITICERWLDTKYGYLNFIEDMGIRPEGLTLDRIDVDGNYEPSNCRWATSLEQGNNRRNNKNRVVGE
jgi:hypothetical protein